MGSYTIAVPLKSRSQREWWVGRAPCATPPRALGRAGPRLWFVRPLPMAARSPTGERASPSSVCVRMPVGHAQCVTAAAARTRALSRVVWLLSRRGRVRARCVVRASPFGRNPEPAKRTPRASAYPAGCNRTLRKDHANACCERAIAAGMLVARTADAAAERVVWGGAWSEVFGTASNPLRDSACVVVIARVPRLRPSRVSPYTACVHVDLATLSVSTCVEWLCARARTRAWNTACVCVCVCWCVCVPCACVRPLCGCGVRVRAARRAGVCVCPATQARNDWSVRVRRTDTERTMWPACARACATVCRSVWPCATGGAA